jgi:EAL domain-containing protein (putative c-di-GMP-specific phosphodiesterase class I)
MVNGSSWDPVRAHLEHCSQRGRAAELVPISQLPFIIGRSRSATLTLCSHEVSKHHAQIDRTENGYEVKDLGSTNGTFVNGRRIDVSPLNDLDILHVGHEEFCFHDDSSTQPIHSVTTRAAEVDEQRERESFLRNNNNLQQMIREHAVSVLFQPIVDLWSGRAIGYEALGRGNHHRLTQCPSKLFELAEKCEMERDLCRLFRSRAITESQSLPPVHRLFINVHPSELERVDFIDSIKTLTNNRRPNQTLVIEVSERFVTSVARMKEIQRQFCDLGLEFAYDDFGAGQARLLELAECSPRFLKLERSLIVGMETSPVLQRLVQALLSAVEQRGIQVIAEGVETERSADLCRQMGCHYAQGFLFCRPVSAPELTDTEFVPLPRAADRASGSR